jgi:hypothetical protein
VNTDETFPFPGAYGWALLNVAWIGYDLWATKYQEARGRAEKPTMSRTLGFYLHQPILGPVLAGVLAGFLYHLLVNERLTALDAALVHSPNLPDITEPPSE